MDSNFNHVSFKIVLGETIDCTPLELKDKIKELNSECKITINEISVNMAKITIYEDPFWSDLKAIHKAILADIPEFNIKIKTKMPRKAKKRYKAINGHNPPVTHLKKCTLK